MNHLILSFKNFKTEIAQKFTTLTHFDTNFTSDIIKLFYQRFLEVNVQFE